ASLTEHPLVATAAVRCCRKGTPFGEVSGESACSRLAIVAGQRAIHATDAFGRKRTWHEPRPIQWVRGKAGATAAQSVVKISRHQFAVNKCPPGCHGRLASAITLLLKGYKCFGRAWLGLR